MKLRILTLMMALASLFCNANVTQEFELSKHWQFSHDKKNWQEVTIPHDWAISGPFDKKWDLQVVAIKENGEETETEHSGRSGALPWIGEGYYKTQIVLPEGTERAELLFDGAMSEPIVYLDGKEVGRWAYGYNAFRIDITPYIKNSDYKGELEVHLKNVEESSRWYPGAGLYRPVKLITSGRVAIDTWGMDIHTIKVENDTALVAVDSQLNGCVAGEYPVITVAITDRNGKVVAETQRRIASDGYCRMELKMPHANLWSPESPYLYKVNTTVELNGQLVDQRTDNLGVLIIGNIVAFVVALLAMKWFVAFLTKYGFKVFGIYRIIAGGLILVLMACGVNLTV